MSDEIRTRVIEIIAAQAVLDPAEVTESRTLAELEIDSLGLVEAVFTIEEAFDISVPFNASDPTESEFDISSVGAIVAAVRALVTSQKG